MSFAIDTGAEGGGSRGPWISFKPKGSAKYGMAYKTWAIRDKTDDGSTIAKFDVMEASGVVVDVYAKGGDLCGSLKLGWEKSDGETGKAPERRWFASPLRSEPRPDESKTAQGGYVWRNAMSVRCAIGGGASVTWEDAGWGSYKGFSQLVKQLNAGFVENEGLCPVVRCIGYVDEGHGSSATSMPQYEILKWVPRPDCLKEDAPAITTASEPAQAVAPVAAAKPAPAPAPDDAPF